ncbi:hypothetical protein [Bradyrhizobium sp.]|uniref:hypothetical protein n=1 Tax=Bradyrhizobium sp. TaxID=376 RepID=UPI003C724118
MQLSTPQSASEVVRLVFQLADRSGEFNGVWQRRKRSLNDRQSLFIEKSVANPASPAS